MTTVSEPEPSTFRDERAAFRTLVQWYCPYLRGSGRLLTWTAVGTVVVLACQAAVPLLVESILHHGEWDPVGMTVLVVLVVLQLVSGHLAHEGAEAVATDAAQRLRLHIFGRTLRSRVLRQDGLVRPSIVSRHTSDVDALSSAFESTMVAGLPSVVRVVQSLILLTYVEWRAGVAMTLASLTFLIVRRHVGRSLLVADRDRLQASSAVGEVVDESITSARVIAGLHLDGWIRRRFADRAEHLRHVSHEQGKKVAFLTVGAHSAGLLGLLVVVFFAIAVGGEDLAAVAAALLYVEGVVRGLEALPAWVRSLQLAVVSQHRIDDILLEPDRPATAPGLLSDATLSTQPGALVGVVTATEMDPDAVIARLSGDDDPDSWRVTMDGHDVRMPGVNPDIVHVPDDTTAFNATIGEHLRAVDPDLDDEAIGALLASVDLSHLAGPPIGLDRPLGPSGSLLTASERQRLSLAMALASGPRILMVGPILAFADVDTAQPLVRTIRAGGYETTVIAVRSPELAADMDVMLFVREGDRRLATHQELLVSEPDYAHLWEQRLGTGDVDLSVLGISEDVQTGLYTRLVTEHYSPGEVIYRQGSPADRIVFTISGHVEITTSAQDGSQRRVAILGPGNHCGDLRLTVGERRAESAYALDDCVVRSLSRDAIAAGLTGLLDRTPIERRVVAAILRSGPATVEQLHERMPDLEPARISTAVALLRQDGALRARDDVLTVVQRRTVKSGTGPILDRLGEL